MVLCMLSEISQTGKDIYHRISLISGILKKKKQKHPKYKQKIKKTDIARTWSLDCCFCYFWVEVGIQEYQRLCPVRASQLCCRSHWQGWSELPRIDEGITPSKALSRQVQNKCVGIFEKRSVFSSFAVYVLGIVLGFKYTFLNKSRCDPRSRRVDDVKCNNLLSKCNWKCQVAEVGGAGKYV